MQMRAFLLAAVLVLTSPAARAADLVIWWEEGFQPEENQAARELIAAFEQKTGKKVELVQHAQDDMPAKVEAAIAAEHPPDFLFGTIVATYYGQWAYEGRLADLTDVLGSLASQFDPDMLERTTLLDGTTGKRGLYALPMGRVTNHVHVWRSMLEHVGFTLADIPREWEPFWSFWCDTVQPAVRKAAGREDIYGVGLAMSAKATSDTKSGFFQFVDAYGADYVTRDGRLIIDKPEVRAGLVKALDAYTAIWRKGCTPPASVDWDNRGNNQAFLAQSVVMTVNNSLSIPNALRATRPEDYYKNAVTLGWPTDARGQPLAIYAGLNAATVFSASRHVAAAKEFVRFLVEDGWLAHWLDFTADRWLPPMPALLETPFWLDPSDLHRMTAAMQLLTQPRDYWEGYAAVSGEWRHDNVDRADIWPKAVHRVTTKGVSPEQAVDEAIARVKQILSE